MKTNQSFQLDERQSKTIEEIRAIRQIRLSEILMKQNLSPDSVKMTQNKLYEAMGRLLA